MMNKKYMFGFLFFALATLVTAGYVVNSFVLTTDVYEPFQVQYAILGDAGNYDGESTCAEYAGEWFDGTDVDVDGLYAGESRKVCTKIVNLGEGDVDYTFSGEVTAGGDVCAANFGAMSVSGTADGSSTEYNGAVVNVADGAAPAENCEITLSVTRG